MSMLCVVSHRFGFICTLIAKNASSALREEFGKERYESEECRYAHVDPRLREQYFTFATLRGRYRGCSPPTTRCPGASS